MSIFIYQLQNNKTKKSYIGSTSIPVRHRVASHISSFKKWINEGIGNYYTSYEVIADNDYSTILLEEIPMELKDTRYQRERYYIETIPDCVNHYIPSRTLKEYYRDNQSEILNQVKEYYYQNREECNRKMKDRYNQNINGYRDKQKERIEYNHIQNLILKELE